MNLYITLLHSIAKLMTKKNKTLKNAITFSMVTPLLCQL